MNRHHAMVAGAAILLTLALSVTQSRAADPRMADFVQAGKIRAALFLPQFAKDPATGELRGVGAGLVAIDIVRALAERLEVAVQIAGYPTPTAAVECLKAGACDVAFM